VNGVHDPEQTSRQDHPVRSVHRALVLLEILAESPRSLPLSELGRQTGWPKSSVFNILTTLAMDGYVAQDPETGRYRVTIKPFLVGGAVVERMDIRGLARPLMAELMEKTGETVNLGIMDGTEAIYLETIAGPGAIRVGTWPGKRLPIHRTALGKALAANLTGEELAAIIGKTGLPPGTPNTHSTFESLLADLELARLRGYAIDDEEDEIGMRCIGAPIRDHRGRTIAAISLAGLAHRMPSEDMPELIGLVVRAAGQISELFGHKEKGLGSVRSKTPSAA